MRITKKLRSLPPNSLFIKISCAVIFGVLCISIFTLLVSANSTRRGYIETMSKSNQQILEMINKNMDEMNDRITNAELVIDNSWAFLQYLKSDKEDKNTFVQVYNMRKQLGSYISGTYFDIVVVGVNGRSFIGDQSSLNLTVDDLLKHPITEDAKNHRNKIIYRCIDKGITKRSKNSSAIVAVKALTTPNYNGIYGYVYIVMRQQVLQSLFNKLNNNTNNLMLVDSTGVIVSSPQNEIVGKKCEDLAKVINNMDSNNETRKYVVLNNKPILVLKYAMSRWNLHIISAFDYTSALSEVDDSKYIFAICLLITGIVLTMVFFFIRQITKPINKLVNTMEHVTNEGLPEHIEAVGGGYEVQKLTAVFSIMIENINTYVKKLVQLEKDKRRMEIHTLQMQINPHFIYNTLTSIKWLIWQKDTNTAIQSIDTFTLLLRNIVNNSHDFIFASEEVKNLENYCFLQKIRFGSQIHTNIYLSPSASNCLMPKLLLQPFLENSFFHAFTDRQEGVIFVTIDCHKDKLICEIIDDGVGIPQCQINEILKGKPNNKGHSIGIPNVNLRIHLLFGDDYGVKIFSEPGHGTSVKVTLPIINNENSENITNSKESSNS